MRVIIREDAYDDLDRIHTWIAKDRPRWASAVIDRILESADRLGQFPHMGHAGKVPGTYEWVIPGLPYILVYEVHTADDLVAATAVFHGAQDRERHPAFDHGRDQLQSQASLVIVRSAMRDAALHCAVSFGRCFCFGCIGVV